MALVLLLIVGCIIGVGVRYSILHTKKYNNSNNHMAIYVPNDNGEGFQLSNYQKIPEGYKLNVEETNAHCSSGITVSWDNNTRTISMTATSGGGCNLYLEEEEDSLIITSATISLGNEGRESLSATLNKNVQISKYVLHIVEENYTYEFDSNFNKISNPTRVCYSKNETYNYTIYAVTIDNVQSEIYNGSYTINFNPGPCNFNPGPGGNQDF